MLRKHYQSLHKEAHDLLQAMALKAERCNTTLEIHSQHTDGGKKTPPLTLSHHMRSQELLSILNMQRNALLTNTGQVPWDGRPSHGLTDWQHILITGDRHYIRGWRKNTGTG